MKKNNHNNADEHYSLVIKFGLHFQLQHTIVELIPTFIVAGREMQNYE